MSAAVNTPPAPAAGEDGNLKAPTPSEVPPASAGAPPAADPQAQKPADIEAARAEVTKNVAKILSDVEEVDTQPPSDPAAPAASTPPAEPPAEGATGSPPPAPPAAPAASPADVELPDVPHPMDAEDDPTLDDVDGRASAKTKDAFDRLRHRLRSAREEGQFGSMIVDVAQSAGLDPGAVASVIALTAKARSMNPAIAGPAITALRQQLTQLGIPLEQIPAAPTAPAALDPAKVTAEADKIFKQYFADDVSSGDMSEAAARRKATALAEERLKALSQPHTPTPPVTQAAPVAPAAPAQPQVDPMVSAASARVNALAQKYSDAYKAKGIDFAPIQAEATKLIAEKVKRDGFINPLHWEYEFAQAVKTVVSKKVAAQQRPAPRDSSLRPGSTPGGGGAQPQDFKKNLASEIVSGKFF